MRLFLKVLISTIICERQSHTKQWLGREHVIFKDKLHRKYKS